MEFVIRVWDGHRYTYVLFDKTGMPMLVTWPDDASNYLTREAAQADAGLYAEMSGQRLGITVQHYPTDIVGVN